MVSNQNFIINEIPEFNPYSLDFLSSDGWWGTHKRKCIEGEWSGGKWMPGPVFFYVNFWKIKLTIPGTKGETISRPWLRDLEWEKGFLDAEARGFSGFKDDEECSCHRIFELKDDEFQMELALLPDVIKQSLYKPNGTFKEYVHARDYLRKIHKKNLGKPLYLNDAKNIMDIEARGGGKSYFASALIAHNFLFDGATDYDEYLERKRNKDYLTSQTLVGAIDAKYSADLLNKVQLGLSEMPGGVKYNGDFFPCPLLKTFKGSFHAGKFVESIREVQIGKNWIEEGSRSSIHHRTFADNPLAGNGTRPNRVWLEEVGFMGNLIESLGALYDCTTKDYRQFGVIWMQGTGGAMASGATQAAEYVFYNPDEFNCLTFGDLYENSKKPIAYFVPKHLTLNEFKDSEGNTNITEAVNSVQKIRNKKAKAKDKSVLMKELENNPEKPSEAFLVPESSYFPTVEIKEWLAEVSGNPAKYLDLNYVGKISFKAETQTYFFEDLQDVSPIREFPIKEPEEGCLEIFELPRTNELGLIEPMRYIAGIDPFDKDSAQNGSLGSIFIFDRLTDRIVAEYTGRPERSQIFYEKCRRLLIFYNATAMYESNLTGLFTYFEKKKALSLLADTPIQLRDVTVWKEGTNTSKGINATEQNNKKGREYYDNWLREPLGDAESKLKLHTIRSIGLLKETSKWNNKGNFDRVSAMGMVMWYRETLAQYTDTEQRQKKVNSKYGSHFNKFKKNPLESDYDKYFKIEN